MADPKNEIFDPLPIDDRNSELEDLSILAFNNALPPDKFRFRRESGRDVGVDGALELKFRGKSTNIRAQIQLKATDSTETNQDGSISVQIATANLNYLLNGHSPMYILYVAPQDKLFYVWAWQEYKRISGSNPDWKRQKSVVIRFKEVLDIEALEHVYDRIQKTARMQRDITDTLNSASNTESPIISISPETLEVTDAREAERILLKSGRLIVTYGFPENVRKLSKLLDEETEKLPLILLVRGFAEYTLGKYQTAYALLSEAQLKRDELSKDDQQFLDFLRKGCEYLTGRGSLEEYSRFLDSEKDKTSGQFAISLKINQIRFSLFNVTDPFQMPEVVDELSKVVKEVLADSNSSNVFKLYATSVWLEVEGVEVVTGMARDIVGDKMSVLQGFSSNLSEIIQEYTSRLATWATLWNNAASEAQNLNHRPLLASLKLTNAQVNYQQLLSTYSLGLILEAPVENLYETAFKDSLKISAEESFTSINEAIEIFQQLGDMHGEIRAKLLMADFYEFMGEISSAQKIAAEVLPKAEALEFATQVKHAEEHLAEQGIRARLKASKSDKSRLEKHTENADWTDEKMRFLTMQMSRVLGLPDDRYPGLQSDYISMKIISQEKLDWCQHISYLQDERHKLNAATIYKNIPNRMCHCELHKYTSFKQNPDLVNLLPVFKKKYCEKCPDRKVLT